MKNVLLFIVLIIAIPFLVSQKPPRNGDKSYVEGQIMVKLRSDVSRAQQEQVFQDFLSTYSYLDLKLEEKLSQKMNIVLMSYAPNRLADEKVLEAIRAYPDVEMAQFNHFISQRELIPSDQYFGLQWNMHNTGQTGGTNDADIDAPEAWAVGNSGVTATGDTIVIAIVDDGVDIDHEDLKFWKNYHDIPDNNIDDDNNGFIDDYDGWNFYSNSPNIVERDHGTHVTGIACAQGDNDRGVAGVNLHVKAYPVLGNSTLESVVVASYSYIYVMRSLYNETGGALGAFIVSTNSSFGVDMGQPEDYPIWGAMYDSMGSVGILSAAATANANWDIDQVSDIPTAFPSEWLISVTNTDPDDIKNTSAAYGDTTIDLGAPGTSIYSTRQTNQYGYKSGCSMASPHVAGAVAYMFSIANKGFMEDYHDDPAGMALIIKQYILAGVDTLPSLMGKTVSGGRLNLYKAGQLMPQFHASILADSDTLCQGDILQLSAIAEGGSGNHSFAWSSSPAGFVSTDSVVTVSPASTTIYHLEISDGAGNIASDSIKVVVIPPPGKPVITSGPTSVDNFTTTFSTYTCSEVSDANAYQWTVNPAESGTTGSTGPEGKILWANSYTGPVTITVSGVNDCGNGTFSDAFTTQVYTSAGLAENEDRSRFMIWPNPASSVLSVKVSGLSAGKDYSLEVFNALGMKMGEYVFSINQNELKINLESFNKGIYFAVLLEGDQQIATKRFIITK